MLGSIVLVLVVRAWGSQEQGTALGGSRVLEALLEQGIVGSTPQSEL